jgi:hypothetical protein
VYEIVGSHRGKNLDYFHLESDNSSEERDGRFVEMLVATKKEQCFVNLGFFESALI